MEYARMRLLVDPFLRHTSIQIRMRFELEKQIQDVDKQEDLQVVSDDHEARGGTDSRCWFHG